jgi:hypothetical protein
LSHLRAEPVESAEKVSSELLQRRRTRPQDPEDGTILIISFHKFCVSNLFIMVSSVLQKASIGVDPHYLDVWQPTHQGNADAVKKMVSISFYSYASFIIFILNSIFCMIDI